MMRYSAMAVGGVLGLLMVKLLMAMVLPLVATVFGVMMMVLKWGLILGAGYLLWSFIRGRRKSEAEVA